MKNYKIIIVLLSIALITACASDSYNKLNLHQYGSLDLKGYSSFAIEEGNKLNPKINTHFTKVISDKFIQKGLKNVANKPDLIVSYMLLTKERDRVVLDTIENPGYGQPHVELVAEFYGGINVQVIDTKKRATVWHASASRDLTNSGPGLNEQRISEDLDKLFSTIAAKRP